MIKYVNLPPGPCELVDQHIVRKKYCAWSKESYLFMCALIRHLMRYPDPHIVSILDFQELGGRTYTYDMVRCAPLSREEKRIVDNWGRPENDTSKYPELAEFLEIESKLDRYHDIHGNNVMISPDNEYCWIDLEGFLYETDLKHPRNKWITK